jgi:hypothetical protein
VLLLAGTLIDEGVPGGNATVMALFPTRYPLHACPLQARTR